MYKREVIEKEIDDTLIMGTDPAERTAQALSALAMLEYNKQYGQKVMD